MLTLIVLPILIFRKRDNETAATESSNTITLKHGDHFTDHETGEELQVVKKTGRPKGSTKKKSRAATKVEQNTANNKALDDSRQNGAGQNVANETVVKEDPEQDNRKDTDL